MMYKYLNSIRSRVFNLHARVSYIFFFKSIIFLYRINDFIYISNSEYIKINKVELKYVQSF